VTGGGYAGVMMAVREQGIELPQNKYQPLVVITHLCLSGPGFESLLAGRLA
jgi:hypothetical protein